MYLNMHILKLKCRVTEMSKRLNNLIAEVSGILGIPATGRMILDSLIRTGKKLSVSEITAEIKRSERSVRAQLKILADLELVRRNITITKNGRLAYQYFAPRINELVETAKRETLRRLRGLEMHLGEIRGR